MTVVVGVDGSPEARAALAWAVEHCRHTGSRVLALAAWQAHVPIIDGAGIGAAAAVESELISGDQLQDHARRIVSAAVAALPPGADEVIDQRVAHGDPTTVLLHAAENAELLVLGNHGHSAFIAAVMGSVAGRCVHRAHCPLVLVPGRYSAGDG